MKAILLAAAALFFFSPAQADHHGVIESPSAFVSGIGFISGWKCTATGPLTVRFNGAAALPLAYGNERIDVRNAGACPSAQVGFVSIMNWGNLGDGVHTAVAYDNGVEFARSTFEVATTGEAFVREAEGECRVPDFPAPGESTRFAWNQSTQHLEMVDHRGEKGGDDAPGVPRHVRVVEAGADFLVLAWDPPPGGGVASYHVYYRGPTEAEYLLGTVDTAGTRVSGAVVPGECYRVTAVNAAGVESKPSPAVCVPPPPPDGGGGSGGPAVLENPGAGSFYSGIGVISGWKCTANGPLTVRFNGGAALPLAYGNERVDVRNAGACPSAQVGFVSIMNWGNLGDGVHTAVAYDNGVEFARSTFEVTTTGEAFVREAAGECRVSDFPSPGESMQFAWNEATQHLEMVGDDPPPVEELGFGGNAVADQRYTQGTAIPTLALPPARGGTPPLTYRLSPALPAGLRFDAGARRLTGTPTETLASTVYTYTVTDATGATASLTFRVSVDGGGEGVVGGGASFAVVSYGPFYVLPHELSDGQASDAVCRAQLGSSFRLADWNDIVDYADGGGSLAAFTLGLRMFVEGAEPRRGERNSRYRIARDGSPTETIVTVISGEVVETSRQHYFVARHDHTKPADFRAEAHLDNYHLSLGLSSEAGGDALCYQTDGPPPPTPFTFTDPLSAGGVGPEMVVIPGGTFRMGCLEGDSECSPSEFPVHQVSVPSFALGQYEVTFAEWDACVAAGGCNGYQPEDYWGRGDRPVIGVSWHDAQSYVAWLSAQTGAEYRLPSEAEWEYAARAGTETKYHWGDNIGQNRANCDDCGSPWDGQQAAPVGSFEPNAFGLYDVHGNVFEWVQDCWNQNYSGAPSNGQAWEAGECDRRAARSASWWQGSMHLRSASRTLVSVGNRSPLLGFRIARTLP